MQFNLLNPNILPQHFTCLPNFGHLIGSHLHGESNGIYCNVIGGHSKVKSFWEGCITVDWQIFESKLYHRLCSTILTFSLFSQIHDKLKLFSISFAGDTAINKGKYLKRGIKSSLLSPSRPINQWHLHKTRHTNQRGFGKKKNQPTCPRRLSVH